MEGSSSASLTSGAATVESRESLTFIKATAGNKKKGGEMIFLAQACTLYAPWV